MKAKVGSTSLSDLRRENRSLKRKLDNVEGRLSVETEERKRLRVQLDSVSAELEYLTVELNEADHQAESQEEKSVQTVSDSVRKCVYFCLMSNVPVDCTSQLIEYIGGCIGSDVNHVPHASTVSRCAYELSVICDLQAAEFMLQAPSLTLAWDATTVKGSHLNLILVTSPDRSMTLTTDVLPGGTGSDYGEHLVNSLCQVVEVYSCFENTEYTQVLSTIAAKLQCTTSDRAAVNHCAAMRLMNYLHVHLLELKCQLHPLECVASAAREALVKHERA